MSPSRDKLGMKYLYMNIPLVGTISWIKTALAISVLRYFASYTHHAESIFARERPTICCHHCLALKIWPALPTPTALHPFMASCALPFLHANTYPWMLAFRLAQIKQCTCWQILLRYSQSTSNLKKGKYMFQLISVRIWTFMSEGKSCEDMCQSKMTTQLQYSPNWHPLGKPNHNKVCQMSSWWMKKNHLIPSISHKDMCQSKMTTQLYYSPEWPLVGKPNYDKVCRMSSWWMKNIVSFHQYLTGYCKHGTFLFGKYSLSAITGFHFANTSFNRHLDMLFIL